MYDLMNDENFWLNSKNIILDTANTKKKNSKRPMQIVFEPFIFTLLILFSCLVSTGLIYYFVFFLSPIFLNFNQLVSATIPSELQNLSKTIAQHNHTISLIENKINVVLSTENIYLFKQIIQNIDRISLETNITQIQNNIQSIVNELSKIIH
jgi:uncharacterized membrane protein